MKKFNLLLGLFLLLQEKSVSFINGGITFLTPMKVKLDAKAKVELAQEYNIPVWVIEPLRGGSLCKLFEEHEAKLQASASGRKISGLGIPLSAFLTQCKSGIVRNV